MNHRGCGWVVGCLVLQLVACGSAAGGAEDPGSPVLPEGVGDGAQTPGVDDGIAGDVSTVTVSPRRADRVDSMRQRGGRIVVGRDHFDEPHASDEPHTSDEPHASDEPVVTPEDGPKVAVDDEVVDTGWEASLCAGVPTRNIRMVGNLDAGSWGPILPFDVAEPWNTANFGSSMTTFDDQGRSQSIWVYFGRASQGWDYHVVMDGTLFVVGEGHLSFDDQGAATVDESQPLRLLTAAGPGHSVELDLTGMTQLSGPCNISEQSCDGREARWGTTCVADAPAVTGPHCGVAATTRLSLRANLAAATPVADEPWDPLGPRADFALALQANDEQGTLVDFELAWRKSSATTWDYHVLFDDDGRTLEVASGALSFNPNGSLRSVTTSRPLRMPNRGGVLGEPIEMDFGVGTVAGGNGVDGVTSLPGGSFEVWHQNDGALLDCLPRPTAVPLPVAHAPSCAGERTAAVSMYFNLDPATALSTEPAYSATTTVYDAELTPQQLDLHFTHVEPQHWQCQVSASSADVGVVDLYFTPNGAPESVENIPLLRLPLADGSAGPPIQLAFDADWVFTSFTTESYGWLAPDGAAPDAHGCVD